MSILGYLLGYGSYIVYSMSENPLNLERMQIPMYRCIRRCAPMSIVLGVWLYVSLVCAENGEPVWCIGTFLAAESCKGDDSTVWAYGPLKLQTDNLGSPEQWPGKLHFPFWSGKASHLASLP